MQCRDVLDIEIKLFRGPGKLDDLDIATALVAHVNAAAFLAFNSEIGQGMLFLIAAEGTLDLAETPFVTALMTEKIAVPVLVFSHFTDFRIFSAS